MNKQYVAPKSAVYNYIQPLTPLCASKEFGVGSSSDPKGVGCSKSMNFFCTVFDLDKEAFY